MQKIDEILKALSEETRLRIINMLYFESELCVCDIVNVLRTTQTKISRHLSYLKNSGLVKDRKHAQWSFYMLNADAKYKFIQEIVAEELSEQEPYISDLINLKKWLEKKDCECI